MVLEQIKERPNLKEQVATKLLASGLKKEVVEYYMMKEQAIIHADSLITDNGQQKTDNRKLVLITGHRRENFGQGFINICEAIKELAEKYPEVDFVYPMHLNPNVRNAITEVFGEIRSNPCIDNVYFIEPLEYLPFVYLMSQSYLVLTDSGGIQEEAPGLGKPVLVMRDTTERPEALNAGTVKLVGTDGEKIIEEVTALINDLDHYNSMAKAENPYGDGLACKQIINVLYAE